MNKAIFIGNIGNDPELKMVNNVAVLKLQLATNERWIDKNNEKQKRTDWHNITCWGKTAEIIAEYTKKGDKIYIEGKIRNNNYQNKDGAQVYGYEIVVEKFEFLGNKDKDENQPQNQQNKTNSNNKKVNKNSNNTNTNNEPPPIYEQNQLPANEGNDDIPF